MNELTACLQGNGLFGQVNYGKRGPRGERGRDGGLIVYEAGDNIDITDGRISVITTTQASQDNTIPITSGGVYTIVGNIEVLLESI